MEKEYNYKSEEEVIKYINTMIKYMNRAFKLIVINNDESYIPNFNFEYVVCDCKYKDLTEPLKWKEYFESDKPIIFINTSYMFNSFYNHYERYKGINGAAVFAQFFYCNFRDMFWRDDKSKFLFIMSNPDDVVEMWRFVNAGFSCELIPIYMKKNKEKTLTK